MADAKKGETAAEWVERMAHKVRHGNRLEITEIGGLIQLALGNPAVSRQANKGIRGEVWGTGMGDSSGDWFVTLRVPGRRHPHLEDGAPVRIIQIEGEDDE